MRKEKENEFEEMIEYEGGCTTSNTTGKKIGVNFVTVENRKDVYEEKNVRVCRKK